MASSTSERDDHPRNDEIRLWREGDWWIAREMHAGVTTQGQSREDALSNLDEAAALHEEGTGREPTADELRAAGIDPADNTTGEDEPPDVLK